MRAKAVEVIGVVTLSFIGHAACSPAASPMERRLGAGQSDGSSITGEMGQLFPDEQPLDAPAPPGCGDGTLTPEDEACDDGNLSGGDGCAPNCLAVEPGYACTTGGSPCRPIARCGDGLVATSELCDDGGTTDGDGCSSRCKLEIGFKCDGSPSVCSSTHCGDGAREGAEACDDGNAVPFDGCSAECQAEPDCSGGACVSACGDGLVLEEQCDDGNDKDGDGCSATCAIEAGFTCTDGAPRETADGTGILRVPVVYRDFAESHPDFEIGCGELMTGIVADALDDDGKPVLVSGANACIESASSFAEWYRSTPTSATIAGELVLYENGSGGFVNQYGANGEPWVAPATYTNVIFGGPGGTGCEACTPSATGACYDPCTPWGEGNTQACCAEESQTSFDGNPLFFPIDESSLALPGERYRAKIPAQYGYTDWPFEDSVFPGAGEHNFHFTTEVVYWFSYDAGASATLDFTGDDDVWVFVNRRLAVDLGGAHVPEQGSVTIDSATGPAFGLVDGSVYEIRVFHAERKVAGSSFRLTLEGFQTARSDCTPVCGDGIVTLGEECDDGSNDGGYDECEPGCVLGARCGDSIVQEGETCDDGNRIEGDGCGSACRALILR